MHPFLINVLSKKKKLLTNFQMIYSTLILYQSAHIFKNVTYIWFALLICIVS